jgi:hypothetical protein
MAYLPADPGADLWQAANAAAASSPAARRGAQPALQPVAGGSTTASSPTPSGPTLTAFAGPSYSPGPGGGPYVSTSLPPGGIVPVPLPEFPVTLVA